MSVREDFIQTALAERGPCVHADGTTKYGAWFGELVGDSAYAKGDFCAMGLLWTANQIGQLDLLGGARKEWAWVPSWWQHWKSIGQATSKPARGRIVFFDFNRSGDPEHVGACLADNRDGTIDTVEYNTLNGQCALRTRNRSDVLGYGDPAWDSAPAPVAADDSCWMG